MQKELEKKEKILKQSRIRRRAHKAMMFYCTLVKILNLQEEEAQCVTDKDFDDLHNRILRKVKRCMKMDGADYVSDDNESLTENPESVDSAF